MVPDIQWNRTGYRSHTVWLWTMGYTKRWKYTVRTSEFGFLRHIQMDFFVNLNASFSVCIFYFQGFRSRYASISQRRIRWISTTSDTAKHPSSWIHQISVTLQCRRRLSRLRWTVRFLCNVHGCIVRRGPETQSQSQRYLYQLVGWLASR